MQSLKNQFNSFPKRKDELDDPHLNVDYYDIRRSTPRQRAYIYGLLDAIGFTTQDALNLIKSDKEDIRHIEESEARELIDILKEIREQEQEDEY